MRQYQIVVTVGLDYRTRSNPDPTCRGSVQNFFGSWRRTLFRGIAIFCNSVSGVSEARGSKATTALRNFGEPGGQSTGEVSQREEDKTGNSEKSRSRAMASTRICRESPRLDPRATKVSGLKDCKFTENINSQTILGLWANLLWRIRHVKRDDGSARSLVMTHVI